MSASQQLNVPQTQKAAIFYQKGGPVKIEELPVTQANELQANQALVKVLYSGVCHTDLHAMLGDWPFPNKLPLIGGHEGAGVIVAIGEHSDTSLKVGDPVGIKWIADSCLRVSCEYCRLGEEPQCPNVKLSGYTVDGSFQQYAVSYTRHLSLIPEGLPLDDAAPILCAGVTVYKALKESGTRTGQSVVIPGAGGGLGHLAIQYAAAMGLRAIAIDTGAEKKALCERLGAAAWIDFKEETDIVKAVRAAAGGDGLGPHSAIVTSASASGYEQALEYVRPKGSVVAVGLPPNAVVKADVFWTVIHQKKLIGSYVGTRQDAAEALELAAAGKVKTQYRVLPFSDLPKVYDDMHHGKLAGRIVLDLWA